MHAERADAFVNAHTHLYSGLAPFGMPPPVPPPRGFIEILERVWWRLDRALDERALRAAARAYVAAARRDGTTVIIDHHESPSCIEGSLDVLAEACQEFEVAALLCYGATERNGGRAEARRGLAECRRFILSRRPASLAGAIGLHASFTVSDDTIREAGVLCRDLGAVLHVHMAEDAADVADAVRRGHAGPLERLLALDALPPGSVLAHGVHLSASQVRRAIDAGCWLVQNPRSNRHNGVGYPRGLAGQPQVALGTDGFPSNMPDEARALAALAAEQGDDEGAAAARLDAGWRLAEDRLGPADRRRPTRPAPSPQEVAAIEDEARLEAERLWARW